MGTVSNLVSSASTATFSGTSSYAADLQQAINHAVAAASIPLAQYQDDLTVVQTESQDLTSIQSNFNSVQSAIQQLSASSGTGALAATFTNASVASVAVDSSTVSTPGTYTLNVINPGAPTTTLSNDGLTTVSDATSQSISSASSFTLTVGSSTYTVTPAGNSLNDLVQAINSGSYGVSATIVNIGSPTSPDYRLSVQGSTLQSETIQLNDGSQDLLGVLTDGSEAQYQVDGLPSTPISSTTNTITIAPGVTANLVEAGQTTITVAPDSSGALNALSAFASAYNSALASLNQYHGSSGGILTGSSIILRLGQSLQDLTGYSGGSGSVQSMADLGLIFNSDGTLSFDQGTFQNAEATDPNGVASFLGTASGSGFLQNATNVLNQLEDSSTGLFVQTQNTYQDRINSDNQQISDEQTRINTLQNNLTAQMSQADTLIASLQSQLTYYTNLFNATQNALKNS